MTLKLNRTSFMAMSSWVLPLCFAASVLPERVAVAQDANATSVEVTVTGEGISEDDARNDALRKALEQGGKVFIDSYSEVENYTLVRDTIYARAEGIVKALEAISPDATLVFTSSISTYGDTSAETPPVRANHSQHAIDIYADSKIAGEALVIASSLKTVVLRVAAVAVPAFL